MKLKLAAEDFSNTYGLVLYDEDLYPKKLDLNEMNFSKDLINDLKLWYNSYYKFTGMTRKELKEYSSEIDKLDKIGIRLLENISISLSENLKIKKFIYYSRGLDKVLFETRKNY